MLDSKWFWKSMIGIMIIAGIVQAVSIIVVSQRCAEGNHSMACVGSACRCVDEVK